MGNLRSLTRPGKGLWRKVLLTAGVAGVAVAAFFWGRLGALPQATAQGGPRVAGPVPVYAPGTGSDYSRRVVAYIHGNIPITREELGEYLREVQDILQKHDTTASFFVHASTGQVHARPFLNLQRTEDVNKLWVIAEEVHGLALNLGGTVSSQHGTGLARTPWVGRQYGRLYPVIREIKSIFDPGNLLNPGKIIGPDPGMPTWPLRQAASSALPRTPRPTSSPSPRSTACRRACATRTGASPWPPPAATGRRART